MQTLMFFLNFILIFALFVWNGDFVFTNIRIAFIKALITIATISLFFTEALSFFGQVNSKACFCYWLTLSLVLFLFIFKKRMKLKEIFSNLYIKFFLLDQKYLKLIAVIIVFFLFPLFFVAVYYPPNNSDSLGYHLPRIAHWIQNNSINHYLTGDYRQLYTPPLSEFILLHLKLLSGSDLWLNLVQFFSMLGCITIISLIVQILGLNYKYQILSGLLVVSIPMGILQSTTTQTDYLAAFFLCAFVYFCFRILFKSNLYTGFIFAGVSLALGFFTKATMAVFAFPFSIWLMLALFFKSWKKATLSAFLFLFMIIILNSPFWIRNYKFCGEFLGPRSFVEMIKNQDMNGKFIISNLTRNVSMHMAFPFANRVFNKLVNKFHENILGITSEEKPITFGGEIYEPYFCIDQDRTGNFFLIFILIFSVLYILFNFKNYWLEKKYYILIYLFCLLSGYLLFSLIFKWQPWITRLDLPFFVISIPLIIYVFRDLCLKPNSLGTKTFNVLISVLVCYWLLSFLIKNKLIFISLLIFILISYFFVLNNFFKTGKVWGIFVLSILIFTFPYVYFNRNTPLLGNNKLLCASREIKYFRANEEEHDKYVFIADALNKYQVKNIFLKPSGCIHEYYLWVILRNRLNTDFCIKNFNECHKNVKNKFYAVVAYIDNPLNASDEDKIEFYENLGTTKDPLSLIILRE